MSPRLEIHVSKPRTLGLLALTCLMVAMCFFCTTLPDLEPRILGWIGVCFFSIGFIVLPRQLFRPGPLVVIDDHGIEDRRTTLGLIDWADVVSLTVGHIRTQKFLCVEVADPQKYLNRFSAAGRIAAKANRGLGFPEITIAFSGLTHSTDQVTAFIRENLPNAAQ